MVARENMLSRPRGKTREPAPDMLPEPARMPALGLKAAAAKYHAWFLRSGLSQSLLTRIFVESGLKVSLGTVRSHLFGERRPLLPMREAIEIMTNGEVPKWVWMDSNEVRDEMRAQTLVQRLRGVRRINRRNKGKRDRARAEREQREQAKRSQASRDKPSPT